MVTKARPSFFARGAAGKYPMDVFELRSAFAASEGLTQKIERFRVERLAKIRRGNLPEPLDDTAVLSLSKDQTGQEIELPSFD